MLQQPILAAGPDAGADLPGLVEQLARCSTRPRYAFMLLTLIAEVADGRGQAGPFVTRGNELALLRDWLSDSLAAMAGRDPRRRAITQAVAEQLRVERRLPGDAAQAEALIEAEVRERVRLSGKSNLSRAISELVAAGLVRRHYQGYRVDHVNRGAQRHAVYTLIGPARCLLRQGVKPVAAPTPLAPAPPLEAPSLQVTPLQAQSAPAPRAKAQLALF